MFQTVFKRYEKKYIIDGGQYEELKNYLTYNAVPDEYGKSRVCSLYYDTPDNRLIRASLDKPIYKEKLTVSHKLRCVKTSNMGSLYQLTYTLELKNPECEKELIDEIRCRNGNLDIVSNCRATVTEEL